MAILQKKQTIGQYVVVFPIKEASYAETYRVKDAQGKNYFLKLINYAKLGRNQFDENGDVVELVVSRQLDHPNLTHYHDSGEVIVNGNKYVWIAYDFISGETVAEKVSRESGCSVYEAKQIAIDVLHGLNFLHSLPIPIIHNEVTIQNVMLDVSQGVPQARLIDFGHAKLLNQSYKTFSLSDLNLFYLAPELFNGVFSIQSDLYSVGALMYHLLFDIPPHFVDIAPYEHDREELIDIIISERQKPLSIPNKANALENVGESLLSIIDKALSFNVSDRFQTADEFIDALNGDIVVERIRKTVEAKNQKINRKHGNGFADVAGMNALKEQLQSDVIDLLKNPEQAKKLGLSLPNGLLFYGPPGCGKTYFAEKFAEELGCNYQYVKCSDVASPFIHGGQEKIAAIFKLARENAPTILFFDEIDAMIMDRSKHNNVSESGEVNEFLAQLNNCGESGVVVIGATNKPNEIDEAALRAGRLEQKYYIPQPDYETRKTLFQIHLRHRAIDFGLDYDRLAELTENFISADIRLIVDKAARLVFKRKEEKITQTILEEAIRDTKPSLSTEIIKKHEAIRDAFEGNKSKSERPRVGFY